MATDASLGDSDAVLGDDLRSLLDYGRGLPAGDLVRAFRARAEMRHRVARLFETVDVLISPTAPVAAYPFAESSEDRYLACYTAMGDLAGIPALSLPMGFNAGGMPLSLQIMADSFRDDLALQAGKAFELATGWHRRRPPALSGGD